MASIHGKQHSHRARHLVLLVCGLYIFMALAVATNYLVLLRTGDIGDPGAIAETQQEQGLVYGGLNASLASVKLASMRLREAETVVIGTSRAMQLRAGAFYGQFYNLGGLANGPGQALALWLQGLMAHRPKLVILVADWWAYGEPPSVARSLRPIVPTQFDGSGRGGREDILLWRIMSEGQFSLTSVLETVTNPRLGTLGLSAARSGGGFRPDGSLCLDRSLAILNWRTEIESYGHSLRPQHYRPGLSVSRTAIATLVHLSELLRESGTRFLILAPPIAPTAFHQLKSIASFNWIAEWREEMARQFGDRFIDAHDPILLGASDDEFYDDIHPGEIAMARVLLKAVDQNTALSEFIDHQLLRRVIASSRGHIASVALKTVPCPVYLPR